MYDTPAPLNLNYMNQQQLPRRYESEEEEVSESELGGHDHAFSPVDTSNTISTFDLDMSADESLNIDLTEQDMERSSFPSLLSPFPSTGKPSRPVSMDTVKRSSSATFVTDSYIFDRDDDMIIELPSPNSTTPLQSPIYLQPAVYVPSEPLSSPRNSLYRSSSPSSVYTDDESDIFTAEQVTYTDPAVKPSLILISPTSEQSSPVEEPPSPESTDGSLYSLEEAAKSQPLLGRTSMDRDYPKHHPQRMRASLHVNLSGLETGAYASRQVDIYGPSSASAIETPHSMSLRTRSMTFSRPKTSFAESSPSLAMLPLALRDSSTRPPSVQSTATFSLFPTVQKHAYHPDEFRSRSISCSHSTASSEYSQTSRSPSRTPSPTPFYSSHTFNRSRSGSLYSVTSPSTTQPKRPPLPYRGSVMKGSGILHGYSSSSLRSEIGTPQSTEPEQPPASDHKSKSRRKKSLRHIRVTYSKGENPSEVSSAKSFVGFMLRGKRKSAIKTPNA